MWDFIFCVNFLSVENTQSYPDVIYLNTIILLIPLQYVAYMEMPYY
jgi:hypothetical protein